MSNAPGPHRPKTLKPTDFPDKEPGEYGCMACGAAEVPAEVWKDLVVGHWLVECAECGVVDLVESADTAADIERRGHK